MQPSNTYMPLVVEEGPHGAVRIDIFSKLMQQRIIFIGSAIDAHTANVVTCQMLHLAQQDPDAEIQLYINSPGGVITAGMAIYDTMNYVPCDVRTICVGQAASMGAFLLSAGAKGKREILPSASVMIHQPLGGAQGQVSDILISAKRIEGMRTILNQKLADHTGQDLSKIEADCDRNFWMNAEEAVAYGMVDRIASPV